MELCKTCKSKKCNKSIVIEQHDNLIITKCLDYEKDKDKIKGYTQPLKRTAKMQPILFDGFISDWSKY